MAAEATIVQKCDFNFSFVSLYVSNGNFPNTSATHRLWVISAAGISAAFEHVHTTVKLVHILGTRMLQIFFLFCGAQGVIKLVTLFPGRMRDRDPNILFEWDSA